MRRSLILVALLAATAALAPAWALRFATYDGFEIHHNAVRADFIPTEVARAQGITRSGSRGLVNIAVLRRAEGGTTSPAEASITLTVFNLAGQSQAVRLRPVREPNALYYIGEFRISGTDTYRFEAEVQPDGAPRAYPLRWSQQLFAD
ncbi:MAG: DUF4426 domain-containing protein [Xanthomonadaceae bacterium]|jgi:hypothetical protein|nr:DUF4426 domain-containing protein [Xanthomonadaceae bacterium]